MEANDIQNIPFPTGDNNKTKDVQDHNTRPPPIITNTTSDPDFHQFAQLPPPAAVARPYCTRLSTKQAKEVSKNLTERELQNLKYSSRYPLPQDDTYMNSDMHRIMQKYVNQLSDLNEKLVNKQDEIVKLKDDNYELKGEVDHLNEIASANDEDIREITEERDALQRRCDQLDDRLYDQTMNARQNMRRVPLLCFICCLLNLIFLLHINFSYQLNIQGRYADHMKNSTSWFLSHNEF
jgi:hypothetical protein